MMPALNPERDVSISLSDGQHINMRHLLRIFAESVRQSQRELDGRQLYLARKLLNSTNPGVLRQLLGVFTFRRYKIAELSVEFAIVRDKAGSAPDRPMRFRLAHGRMKRESVRQASVKVSGGDQALAEFRIDGELIDSVVISDVCNGVTP